MKRIHLLGLAAMAVLFGTNSCIFEAPGDKFYRTLWACGQSPRTPLEVEAMTLEFLCGQRITLRDSAGIIFAHGTYSPDGNVAVLNEVSAVIDQVTVTFLEAHRNGDTLFLLWLPADMTSPFTTTMQRQSAYKNSQDPNILLQLQK